MSVFASKEFDRVDCGDGQLIHVKKEFSYGEMADLLEVLDSFGDKTTTAQTIRTAGKVCEMTIVGWEGIEEPFSAEAVKNLKLDVMMTVSNHVTNSLNARDDKKKGSQEADHPQP